MAIRAMLELSQMSHAKLAAFTMCLFDFLVANRSAFGG
jgi:hypothetical protein